MEFYELIKQRHSVRKYKTDKVEDEKLAKILEAARIAPTADNRQPFKLVVIRNPGHEEELRKIYNREWFVNAPLIIGIFAKTDRAWVRSDGKNYGFVDCAIVMDHISLAATDLGLGTCWTGAFDPGAAKEVIGLGEEFEPVAFMPVGYPDVHKVNNKRKNLDELVIYK